MGGPVAHRPEARATSFGSAEVHDCDGGSPCVQLGLQSRVPTPALTGRVHAVHLLAFAPSTPSRGTVPPACDLPTLIHTKAAPGTPAVKRGIRVACLTAHTLHTSRPQARSIASPINRANSATARNHFFGEGGLFPRPPPDSLPCCWLGAFGGDDFPPPPLVPPLPPFELFATDMAPAVRGAAHQHGVAPRHRQPISSDQPGVLYVNLPGVFHAECSVFSTIMRRCFSLECVRSAFAIAARSGRYCTVEAP